MPRSKTAALVVSIGLIGLVVPSKVAGFISLLPGIDIASFPFLRWWAAVYIAAGTLVEWNLRFARPPQLKRVVLVTLVCVAVLFFAVLLSDESAVFENVALSLGVVIPLVVGSMETSKSRLAALLLVLVPIGGGTVVVERPASMAAPAVWVPTVFTLYSLACGLPFYVLGRAWRMGEQNQGGRKSSVAFTRN